MKSQVGVRRLLADQKARKAVCPRLVNVLRRQYCGKKLEKVWDDGRKWWDLVCPDHGKVGELR